MSPNPALPSSHLKGDLEGLDQAPEDDQPLRAHSHPDVAGPARSPHQPAVHVQLQPLRGDAESHSVPAPITEQGNWEPVLPRGVGKRQNTKFGSDSSCVSPGLHPYQLPGSLSIHPQWKGGAVILKARNHHAWLYKQLLAGEKQPGPYEGGQGCHLGSLRDGAGLQPVTSRSRTQSRSVINSLEEPHVPAKSSW